MQALPNRMSGSLRMPGNGYALRNWPQGGHYDHGSGSDWNLELQRFINRVWTYLVLVNDNYPSTDDHQWVRLDYPYPDAATDLNRWLPLVKWLLAIPHYIVLFFLDIALFFVVIAAWFAILFTGRYPRGMFSFVEGVFRWHNRVAGYALTLVTDQYPPFRLAP